jgi:hypothetical protein
MNVSIPLPSPVILDLTTGHTRVITDGSMYRENAHGGCYAVSMRDLWH